MIIYIKFFKFYFFIKFYFFLLYLDLDILRNILKLVYILVNNFFINFFLFIVGFLGGGLEDLECGVYVLLLVCY